MTVVIKIRALRGTTTYEFETIQGAALPDYKSNPVNDYKQAELDASAFETWLSDQAVRQAYNDAHSLTQGAQR